MVDRYGVEAVKGRTNYMDGRVSGPVIIDALLERGAITVASANTVGYKGKVLGMKSLTFGVNPDIDVVNRGEYFIQLDPSSTGHTYAATEGRPVVSKVASTGGVAGVLLEFGKPLMVTPSTTPTDTVTARISGKYMAVEPVKFYAMEYHPVLCDGATGGPIAVGDTLKYDVSAGKWLKDSGAGGKVISCHYASADDQYVGALFGPRFAVSQA